MAKVIMPSNVADKLASVQKLEEECESINSSSEVEEAEEEEETDALDFIKGSSSAKKNSAVVNTTNNKNNVIYIGHLPKGMEEEEIAAFLQQFGSIECLKLSRSSKAPYRPRGYCFVKFHDSSVAAIVASTLSGYIIMQEKRLVSHVVPFENVHSNLFKNSSSKGLFQNKKPVVLGLARKQQQRHAAQHNRKVNETFSSSKKVHELSNKLCQKEKNKRQKLALLGIDYDFPGYTQSFSNNVIVSTTELTANEKEDEGSPVKTDDKELESSDEKQEIVATPMVQKVRSPIQTRSAKKLPSDENKEVRKKNKNDATVDSVINPSSDKAMVNYNLTTPSKSKTSTKSKLVAEATDSSTSNLNTSSFNKPAVEVAALETPSNKTKKSALRSPIGTRSAKKRQNNEVVKEEIVNKESSIGDTNNNLSSKGGKRHNSVDEDKPGTVVNKKVAAVSTPLSVPSKAKNVKASGEHKEKQSSTQKPSAGSNKIEKNMLGKDNKIAVNKEVVNGSKNEGGKVEKVKGGNKVANKDTDDSDAKNVTLKQNPSKKEKQSDAAAKALSKTMLKRSMPAERETPVKPPKSAEKEKTSQRRRK
jgi:nucleolar protein 15